MERGEQSSGGRGLRLNVPDAFIHALKKIGREMEPEKVIDALIWASENPEKAEKVAEGCKALNYVGKREFETCLLIGNEPDYALEQAKKHQAEEHEKLSLLRKVTAHAKKGGYEFTLPNGVKCIVKKKDKNYVFTFSVGEEKISLIMSGYDLSWRLPWIVRGNIEDYWVKGAIYRGKKYPEYDPRIGVLLEAIRENVSPHVCAVTASP